MKGKENMITKEDFIAYMDAIKKVVDFSDKYNDIIHEYADGYVFMPDCTVELIEVLEKIFNDEDENISYFVWELEFGERWHPGMITITENGTKRDIKMQTVEDLWEVLNE